LSVSRHSSRTRDTSAWIFNTVSVHAMAKPARRRDAVHLAAIYRHRPRFGPSAHARWTDELGERTRPAAMSAWPLACSLPTSWTARIECAMARAQ